MRTLILCLICSWANATTYYFAEAGNDAGSGTLISPWKSISKFNAVTKNAGDVFLFNRGDIFYGKIILSKSGTANSPIYIGAYGLGNLPVITGFADITSWSNQGGNIWESPSISALPYTNMIAVNGAGIPMGRFPNTGHLTWQSHTGNVLGFPSTITVNGLTGSWIGAEVAFNSTTYMISRDKITAQSGNTLTYTTPNPIGLFQPPSTYFVQSLIIQNDLRTLDTQNEWYYNPSTKKLSIYSSSIPSNVQIATIDTLIYLSGKSYIVFSNLSFQGANTSVIEGNSSNHIVIKDCEFINSGRNAIHGSYNSSLTAWKIEGCYFNHTYNNAIDLGGSGFDTIRLNTIMNTGNVPFNMNYYSNAADALMCQGSNNLIEYNHIDSVGYCGIRHLGSNTIIQNNYIANFCTVLYDGGGTYTWNGPETIYSGIKLLNNIIINGNDKNHGIYLDQAANGTLIQGNTLVNCERGIYLDNVFNVQILDNTCYDNLYGILLEKRDEGVGSNIIMRNNIFFARTNSQRTLWDLTSTVASFPLPFDFDYNFYARPIDDNLTFQTYLNAVFTQRNLAGWQVLNGQDAHSKKSPKTITSLSDLRFEYNESNQDKMVGLPYQYIDVKGNFYNGSINLPPYSSAVLIKNGNIIGNKPPKAYAGEDQTIDL